MSVFYVQESKNGQTSEALARKVYGQATSSAFVMFRFKRSGPPEVSLGIWAVVINSIQHFPWRFFSYIFRKNFKIIEQALAYVNSACSVVFPSSIVGIGTSLDYRGPNFVQFSFAAPVGADSVANLFAVKASATDDFPHEKRIAADDLFGSAIAKAVPHRAAVAVHVGKRDDKQSSEFKSRDIFECRHDGSSRERLRLGAARVATSASSRRHSTTGDA